MRVPMLDLGPQYKTIEKEIRTAVDRVLESRQFILGDIVAGFERAIAAYCGVPHAVGCASGSDALLLALMALEVGPGDEVITSPFSFYSTASSITRLGAVPVFADIDPETFNINPAAIEACLSEKTRAILPVHLYGQTADMHGILRVAERAGIPVVEDAAQAIGARFDGKPAGSMGTIGCFSFYPSKNLGAFGDGGLLTTRDPQLTERLKVLRNHGEKEKYVHYEVGINSRLDALQAAVLEVKIPYLDRWSDARRDNAAYYGRLLGKKGLVPEPVRTPYNIESENKAHRHIFNQYTLRVKDRDRLAAHLSKAGIGNAVYYPVPLYLQPCFSYLGYAKDLCPETERAAKEVISLPIYPELTREQQEAVVEAIAYFYSA
jgi:dTDP-4-amino-4,6-dideoxygalactose transaminase